MKYEEIETLIQLTPMKIMAGNLTQIATAIEDSYQTGNLKEVKPLVRTGQQLLDAIAKLGEA